MRHHAYLINSLLKKTWEVQAILWWKFPITLADIIGEGNVTRLCCGHGVIFQNNNALGLFFPILENKVQIDNWEGNKFLPR